MDQVCMRTVVHADRQEIEGTYEVGVTAAACDCDATARCCICQGSFAPDVLTVLMKICKTSTRTIAKAL